jgi:prolipoprotein diacylglyceryl transferase
MSSLFFLILFALLLASYLLWGITTLPRERWQILASIPVRKRADGQWEGINLTWYGLLTANAYAAAISSLFILLGALGIPLPATALMVALILILCVPASRLVARAVEGKTDTFTVGGAVFVGVLAAPWVVLLLNRMPGATVGMQIPPAAALAALAIAYAFGEGLGRLACISFGCCYGKPLSDAPSWLRRLFARRAFFFSGKTKKIAYAGGLDGVAVLPVQGMTAAIYVAFGLIAVGFFLREQFAAAFVMTMVVTQGWRILSEILRADYRGTGRISAYQVMGGVSILYGAAAIALTPAIPGLAHPDLVTGLAVLWQPTALIFLQCIWLIIFIYTGRSTVTGAILSFHVDKERI